MPTSLPSLDDAAGMVVAAAVIALIALVVASMVEAFKDRLVVLPALNATGDTALDGKCQAMSKRMEVEVVDRVEKGRRWMTQNFGKADGLELAGLEWVIRREDWSAAITSLLASAPAAVPSSLALVLQTVARLFRQRGVTVSPMVEFVPDPGGHRLALTVHLVAHPDPRGDDRTTVRIFEEGRVGTGAADDRLDALVQVAVWWIATEVTRVWLLKHGARRGWHRSRAAWSRANVPNTIGLLLNALADRNPDFARDFREMALAEFERAGAGSTVSTLQSFWSQYYAGYAERRLADMAAGEARELWLTRARASYSRALESLGSIAAEPRGVVHRHVIGDLEEKTRISRVIAGLPSHHPHVRAEAESEARRAGALLERDPVAYIERHWDATLLYDAACMWAMLLTTASDRTRVRRWAVHALAAALARDGATRALWAADRDPDLARLGCPFIRGLEAQLADRIDADAAAASSPSRVHELASALSGWRSRRVGDRVGAAGG